MRSLRKLTPDGLRQFGDYLAQLVHDPTAPPPADLLDSPSFTRIVDDDREVPSKLLATRWDAAVFLDELLADLPGVDVMRDEGLWGWLSLNCFDSVCPLGDGVGRKVGDPARYLLQAGNYQRYYRHLLAMPFRIYRAHADNPERAKPLLAGPVPTPGELAEQISAYQELVSNPHLVDLVRRLYWDSAESKLKRGAGGAGPGSPRRLAAVADQLGLTFDFYSMKDVEIRTLLPKEFDRFVRS